jgi:hypothetical protein
MRAFLLTFVKGLIPGIVDTAIAGALVKLREDVQSSKYLKPEEKDATLRGADLLSVRVKEELVKQLSK